MNFETETKLWPKLVDSAGRHIELDGEWERMLL